ncbi:unnamed protein product [Mytilus coruscus]|uniref:OTU domain-containing protein n=1 Tax=Mytilus coruscus TaxID=42192 RepID=A0A6J8A1W6_MYTCO|nr:unnamed protein product [Mytilus coruscus]
MHYYVSSPGKSNQRSQKLSSMDSYLSSLGLWRKPVARDGFCLFRATSEQVYMTQAHYEKLYNLSKEFFYRLEGIDQDYVWTESDAMFSLSVICRHNFLVYEVPGCPPYLAIDNCFSENVMLCRIDATHLESVFPKSYVQDLALCQSIVYDILYHGVYNFGEEEIKEAIQIIREQEGKQRKKSYRYSGTPCSSPDSSDSSGEQSPEKACILYNRHSEDTGIFIIKPPVPFRIAKALDPLIYRNTELDIWEEDKREARHKAIVYCPGDRCMIVSEEGKQLYHGHIQEVFDNKAVIAFIEELGERKEVDVDRLRPDKSAKARSIIKHWQKRRMKAMTVEQNLPPRMTQPAALPPPPLSNIQNDKQAVPVSNMPPPPPVTMAVPLQPPPVFHQPPLVAYGGPMMEQPPHPHMNVPVACLGMDGQPPPIPPHMMNGGAMVAYNGENGMMGQENMTNPVVYVPFMETIMPTEVNVDYPPSEDSRGLDLPLNDINTLRFFFNLGVSHYRTVSLLSHSMAASHNGITQGQSPIVLCQSAPVTKYKTSPSNGVECAPVFTTFIQPTTHSPDNGNENDDRSSNISNDSGCEANKNDSEQDNVKNNEGSMNERNGNSSDMSISDSVSTPPPEIDTSSDHGYKTVKRRKYFMYKNLKLIKPIKEIPTKYLDLLKYLSLEKSRCEGEPIILAPQNVPQPVNVGNIAHNQMPLSQCNSCQVNLNPSAQSFVPGKVSSGMVISNLPHSCSSQGNNNISNSKNSMPPPSSPSVHTACSSHTRLPNMPKPYVSPLPHNINFSHFHTIPFPAGQ